MGKSRPVVAGAIVLYFVIALEVLVMISPFAGFFYAAFNPFLPLYYLLARDEERRMVAAFGDEYRAYMARTGMFLPASLERALARLVRPVPTPVRAPLALALVFAIAVGSAFAARAYTVAHLPLWTSGRVSAIPVLAADSTMLDHRMRDVLRMPEIATRLANDPGPVLAYVVPVQYVMQGMIADTDPAYRLYEHHQTIPMIADWIFHPFRHLEGGHAMMHHADGAASSGPSPRIRRVIFLRVTSGGGGDASTRSALFSLAASREPRFFADVDMHALTLVQVRELGPGTGWGRVPTPMF